MEFNHRLSRILLDRPQIVLHYRGPGNTNRLMSSKIIVGLKSESTFHGLDITLICWC